MLLRLFEQGNSRLSRKARWSRKGAKCKTNKRSAETKEQSKKLGMGGGKEKGRKREMKRERRRGRRRRRKRRRRRTGTPRKCWLGAAG